MDEIDCTAPDGTCRCVASDLFALLGRKYAMDVLCVLARHDRVRFGGVEAHLPGASTSTLASRLDELEAEALLRRERFDEIPPRVEYELTAWGRDLAERLEPVAAWSTEFEASS